MLHVFIINSFAGKGDFSDKIRKQLKQLKNIQYLVFNSEYPEHERILANQIQKLFPDENIRFYACGGSGTFRNILSAIENFDRVEIAECPYGLTNDFLAFFGKQKSQFQKIDNMVKGKTINLDYIDTNLGAAHNTVSAGMDVALVRRLKRIMPLNFIPGSVSYVLCGLAVLFQNTYVKCRIVLDGEEFEGQYEMISFANGNIIGGNFVLGVDNSPVDGLIDVILFPKKSLFMKCRYFNWLMRNNRKNINKYCIVRKVKSAQVYESSGKKMLANYDGELVMGDSIKIEIKKQGCKYVIPQGMEIQEEWNVL